jgi:hypothetical protein
MHDTRINRAQELINKLISIHPTKFDVLDQTVIALTPAEQMLYGHLFGDFPELEPGKMTVFALINTILDAATGFRLTAKVRKSDQMVMEITAVEGRRPEPPLVDIPPDLDDGHFDDEDDEDDEDFDDEEGEDEDWGDDENEEEDDE